MKIQEVYDYYYRNWARAMKDLELSENTYRHWIIKGYIPIHAQFKIEEKLNGKLTADLEEVKNPCFNLEK
jgi:hypothetical protein